MKSKKRIILHFINSDCKKQSIFDRNDLRYTTNPADVNCSVCIREMSEIAKKYRDQIIHNREIKRRK